MNYLYNIAYQILLIITPLATAPYLSRVIGADGVGIFSYTYSVATYFALFGLLGLTNYGSRSIAKAKDNQESLNRTFSGIFYLQLITSITVSILYFLYIYFVVADNHTVAWIQSLGVISCIINLNWFFWGLEEFKVTVTRNFIIKLISFASTFIFVRTESDLWKYTLIIALGTFLGNATILSFVHKHAKLVKVSIKEIFSHLIPNAVLFLPYLSVSIYRTMDKIMLGKLSSYSQLGYFENAEKIIMIFLGCIIALGQVMLPKSANLIMKGKIQESNQLLRKSMRFVSLFTSALMFGTIGIAHIFVPVFFGKAFTPSTSILILLAPNLILLAWSQTLTSQFLIPRGKDKINIMSTALGAVVNITVNLMLIYWIGAIGAAVGTIAAEISRNIYIVSCSRKELEIKAYIFDGVPYFVVGAFMGIIVYLVGNTMPRNAATVIVQLAVGALVYLTGCILLMYKNKDELLIEIKNFTLNLLRRMTARSA